jgi:hypothetical protein
MRKIPLDDIRLTRPFQCVERYSFWALRREILERAQMRVHLAWVLLQERGGDGDVDICLA